MTILSLPAGIILSYLRSETRHEREVSIWAVEDIEACRSRLHWSLGPLCDTLGKALAQVVMSTMPRTFRFKIDCRTESGRERWG